MYEVWFGNQMVLFNDFFRVVRAVIWYEYPSEIRVFKRDCGKEVTSFFLKAAGK